MVLSSYNVIILYMAKLSFLVTLLILVTFNMKFLLWGKCGWLLDTGSFMIQHYFKFKIVIVYTKTIIGYEVLRYSFCQNISH